MTGGRYRICAAITADDPEAVKSVEAMVDIYEVRIDLIGEQWRGMISGLEKPWIACNRRMEEGGRWQGSESDRIGEIMDAVALGAGIIDIELATHDVRSIVNELKGRAECLLSYHNLEATPPLEELEDVVRGQLDAGADICKVVTSAENFTDNVRILKLIECFHGVKIISFAMGPQGYLSRVLAPLVGGYLTYAAIAPGKESAPGQVTAGELREVYEILRVKE